MTAYKKYSVTCFNADRTKYASDEVEVNVMTVDVKVNGTNDGPFTVQSGADITLTWTSTNAATCSINWGTNSSNYFYNFPVQNVTASKNYKVTCVSNDSTKTADDEVQVFELRNSNNTLNIPQI